MMQALLAGGKPYAQSRLYAGLVDPCVGHPGTSWCETCETGGGFSTLCMACDRERDGCRQRSKGVVGSGQAQ